MKHFDSILVANRGEIAVRVIRSAQEQGYRAIAVYSEADTDALHVKMADEAVLIGAAPVKDSYLDAKKILHAARVTGAQAIHPGYGFLSENAEFSQACSDAGLVFIGPTPEAIDIMGNKAASKRRMLEADVPCIPGYQDEDQADETLLAAAQDIGVPIMVKAAAGGGGRGMRLVDNMDEGNVIHLGERDCSVQRRHQKVVEESPCPVMTPDLREAMGRAAVDAATSINYVGAGTVEFLLDSQSNFYFLEMNTRLQVEHPVTEMVTGADLVALQFHVAQGYSLPLAQEEVHLDGHAIEVRLYAEDTANDFLPATGTAHIWQPPSGEGIRVDHGLLQGQEISPFYDPMIAKIIAWGEDRDIARRRLVRALQTTCLFGLVTNREFLIDVLNKQAFADGEATTAFIEENYTTDDLQHSPATPAHALVAACLLYREALLHSQHSAVGTSRELSGWGGTRDQVTHFRFGEEQEQCMDVFVREAQPGIYQVKVREDAHEVRWLGDKNNCVRLAIDTVQQSVQYALIGRGEVAVQILGSACLLTNQLAFTKGDEEEGGSGTVTAPMHGNVLEIMVAVGERVEPGQDLAVMEAMKMEHRLSAQVAGEVVAVHISVGEQVAAGVVVLEITADEG